ncbi:IS110 family transposase [Streptomyces huasconensis]|uniref:IS110 family transposase n=1 Tax=Streptomyces huasconensis TaxID=1854574 RepID=UPI0036F9254A
MGRIDWPWGLQDFVVIDRDGATVLHLRVEESHEGTIQILNALRGLNPSSHRFSRRQVPIAIEVGTWLLVAELRRHRQPIIVVPPAVTARYRGRHTTAVSKPDRTDAELLTEMPDPLRVCPGPARSHFPAGVLAASTGVPGRVMGRTTTN